GWHPSGSAILPVINSAEKVSSSQIIRAQVYDQLYADGVFQKFFEQMSAGNLRVIGDIKAEKREYTFTIKDTEGNTLHTSKDIYNPNTENLRVEDSFLYE
ncbi:MAG: hypothetical protein LBD22_06360, partial [Spirochaetaceae bacterium]|nr:hypothetical protein [Spirochaetaceae bacterium]